MIGIVGHPTTPDADDLARQEDDVRLAARAARHFGTSLLAHLPPT